jgi:hypothetical protein
LIFNESHLIFKNFFLYFILSWFPFYNRNAFDETKLIIIIVLKNDFQWFSYLLSVFVLVIVSLCRLYQSSSSFAACFLRLSFAFSSAASFNWSRVSCSSLHFFIFSGTSFSWAKKCKVNFLSVRDISNRWCHKIDLSNELLSIRIFFLIYYQYWFLPPFNIFCSLSSLKFLFISSGSPSS